MLGKAGLNTVKPIFTAGLLRAFTYFESNPFTHFFQSNVYITSHEVCSMKYNLGNAALYLMHTLYSNLELY